MPLSKRLPKPLPTTLSTTLSSTVAAKGLGFVDNSSNTTSPKQPLVMSDELGKCIGEAMDLYQSSTTFEDFVCKIQGPSNSQPYVGKLPHPTVTLLDSYQNNGVPCVTTTDPWDTQRKEDTLHCGAHQLAYQCLEFVQ